MLPPGTSFLPRMNAIITETSPSMIRVFSMSFKVSPLIASTSFAIRLGNL